jgi:ribosome biogenesis GTPase
MAIAKVHLAGRIEGSSISESKRSDLAPCEGTVIRAGAGHCTVVAGGVVYHCKLRGRLKLGRKTAQTVVVVGDRVRITPLPADAVALDQRNGVVEEVLPRRNKISRRAARRAGGRIEQVLMANLDQIVAVQSVAEPAPQSGFVDRLLVAAERYGAAGVLCLNKIDLDPDAAADPRWDYYGDLGYVVVRTSAKTGAGCEDLARELQEKTSLLLGASGVGKSSLLNVIEPGLKLAVAAVTEKTGLGRHTTSRTELFPLAAGGFLADSPGLRGFDPWDIEPSDLSDYFRDFREAAHNCRYRTCRHRDEPDCGVKNAVVSGSIPVWRHAAYLALLSDLEERARADGPRGPASGDQNR